MSSPAPTSRHSPKRTKTILIRILLAGIIIAPLTIFYSVYLTTYLKRPVPNTAWVSWYQDPQHEVYVGWETSDLVRSQIKYGTTLDVLSTTLVETTEHQFHIANITGLTPDTQYFYEVVVEKKVYASGSFRTAPNEKSDFKFALTSDTQQKFGPGWHAHLADILTQKDYAFISFVGDFVEEGVKAEWQDFFATAKPYLKHIPIVPVQGNHDKPRDYNDDGVDEYLFQQYFPQSEDTVVGTNQYDKARQSYYSFDWGSVHFSVLHFPEVDIDDFDEPEGVNPRDYGWSFTEDHLAWIRADLAAAQDVPFRVVMFHCPITGAGFYGPNFVLIEELLPILHEYNVTASVHGHAHHYERGVLENPIHPGQDLTYFVVGCGGGLADVGLRPVNETRACTASPCYTEAQASASTLTFTTYSFEGTIIDQCIIHAGGEGQ